MVGRVAWVEQLRLGISNRFQFKAARHLVGQMQSRYACGRVDVQDVKYTTSMKTGWKPPLRYRLMPEEERQKLRDMFRIVIDGHGVPPPIPSFQVRASSGRRCTGNT